MKYIAYRAKLRSSIVDCEIGICVSISIHESLVWHCRKSTKKILVLEIGRPIAKIRTDSVSVRMSISPEKCC